MTEHICLIAAKGTSHRWPGKNLQMLPQVLAAIPVWIEQIIVGTDCYKIAELVSTCDRATIFFRHYPPDTEPVADVWRRMAEDAVRSGHNPRYCYCPLANTSGLTFQDYMRMRMLLRAVDQAKSYAPDGTESGLFACKTEVLLHKKPIAAYTGSITTINARELHYADEQD
jgi:hypothetical protein